MADQASSIYNRYSEANDGIAHFSRTSSVRRCQHTDWDICESVRLQELQEARERAAQMEKTMRWWSECTAGWRAKWSVVRDERNRAREEGQSLRSALLQAHEKIDGLQGEKREVEMELQKTKTALHKLTVSHLQANKPVDEIPKEEERIDESTETEIEVLTVQTQTDDVAHADSFEVMSPSSRSFLAGPFTSRERNAFEERCSDLQGQLIDSRNMVAELEAVREALKDEIVELRRCQPTINGVQYRKDTMADDSERARTDSRNMTVKQWQMVVPIVHITDEDAQ